MSTGSMVAPLSLVRGTREGGFGLGVERRALERMHWREGVGFCGGFRDMGCGRETVVARGSTLLQSTV